MWFFGIRTGSRGALQGSPGVWLFVGPAPATPVASDPSFNCFGKDFSPVKPENLL